MTITIDSESKTITRDEYDRLAARGVELHNAEATELIERRNEAGALVGWDVVAG